MSFRPLKWVEDAPPRAQAISSAEWNRHKDYITQLHRDGRTRKDISHIMARDFGFRPSAHQYISQFEKWNLKRYNTARDPTQPRHDTSAVDVPHPEGTVDPQNRNFNVQAVEPTESLDADSFHSELEAPADLDSNVHTLEEVLGGKRSLSNNPFSDWHDAGTFLDQLIPVFSAGHSTVLPPAMASVSRFGDYPTLGREDCDILPKAEDLIPTGNETPRFFSQGPGSSISDPNAMEMAKPNLDFDLDAMVVSAGSTDAANPFDSASETSSVVTVARPSNIQRPNIPFSRVYNREKNPFSLRIEVERLFGSPLWDARARANRSRGSSLESLRMLSVEDRVMAPSIASQTGHRQAERENSSDDVSDWRMSIQSRSLSPMTDRVSALVLSSENVNTPELLRDKFSGRQLRNVRRLVEKGKISNEELRALLQSADFPRVSLLFEDGLGMHLLVYLFLVDANHPLADHFLVLQAITGCVESTRTISGVRLVKDILLRASANYSSASFLEATGFPLPYLFGHIAMLEHNNDLAVRYFRQAVQELGAFKSQESTAVTWVLAHQLVTKLETLNARQDPNFGRFSSDLDWLNNAYWELRHEDSPSTLPTAVKELLTWCISTMDDEKLDWTIEDCFLLSAGAIAVDRDGSSNSLHATLIMCAHFWTM